MSAASAHPFETGFASTGLCAGEHAGGREAVAQAVLAGAWRALRAAGFHEAEVQALFDQIADRPEDLARRLRKIANGRHQD
ncbi:hypothetical protein [Caulobacter sp. B11]|uniref:hypothetical protein n=1 Tax=Caulobacter sp. B11 TaxID=2048899 RepID=UPI00117F7906